MFCLLQFSPEDDPDRGRIQQAIGILRNVATAINEFKRRKDLGIFTLFDYSFT